MSPTTTKLPLVVDLDGTLTPTDTLAELLIKVVKQSPLNLLRLPFWLMKGRAGFKEAIAARAGIAAEHLPYRAPLLDYLREDLKAAERDELLKRHGYKALDYHE